MNRPVPVKAAAETRGNGDTGTQTRARPGIENIPRQPAQQDADHQVVARARHERPRSRRALGRSLSGCNWAALTGERTDDVSIDVDGAAGRASLLKLPPLPATLTVRTGRADVGHQLHYRYPCGRDLHNSADKIAPGIDVRGNNGVAVIPDSIHPKTGIVYSWADARDRATLPDSWADLIEQDWQTRHAPSRKAIELGQDNHFEPAQADHDANPRNYPFRVLLPRHRTNGLLRSAGKLERKGVPFQRIKELLLAENIERCRPPLPTAKVIYIASDVTSRYLPFDVA